MIIILSNGYEVGSYNFMDYLNEKTSFQSQREIADNFGRSLRTVESWISKAKKDGVLKIFRYEDNNFIYCIGADVENMYDANTALAAAKYRDLGSLKEDFDMLTSEEQEQYLKDAALFDDEVVEAKEDSGYVDVGSFVPPPFKQKGKKLTASQNREAHNAARKLGY